MHRGYTKRWRKRWDKKLHKDRLLWIMADYLVDHAAHTSKTVYFERFGMLKLERGQCAYSYAALAKELFASPKETRTRISILKKLGFLAHEPARYFSIITILNYNIYNPLPGEEGQANGQAKGKQRASKGQQTNKLKELKELKETYGFLDLSLWKDFRTHRRNLKAPLTERAEQLLLKKLSEHNNNGTDPNELIKTSIERGWKGIFPPEDKDEYVW